MFSLGRIFLSRAPKCPIPALASSRANYLTRSDKQFERFLRRSWSVWSCDLSKVPEIILENLRKQRKERKEKTTPLAERNQSHIHDDVRYLRNRLINDVSSLSNNCENFIVPSFLFYHFCDIGAYRCVFTAICDHVDFSPILFTSCEPCKI